MKNYHIIIMLGITTLGNATKFDEIMEKWNMQTYNSPSREYFQNEPGVNKAFQGIKDFHWDAPNEAGKTNQLRTILIEICNALPDNERNGFKDCGEKLVRNKETICRAVESNGNKICQDTLEKAFSSKAFKSEEIEKSVPEKTPFDTFDSIVKAWQQKSKDTWRERSAVLNNFYREEAGLPNNPSTLLYTTDTPIVNPLVEKLYASIKELDFTSRNPESPESQKNTIRREMMSLCSLLPKGEQNFGNCGKKIIENSKTFCSGLAPVKQGMCEDLLEKAFTVGEKETSMESEERKKENFIDKIKNKIKFW